VLSVDARNDGIVEVIAGSDADVVCVHNAAQFGRWRQRAAALARRSGRVVVVPGGRAAGANLVLSTLGVDVVATSTVRLPGGDFLHPAGAALTVLRREGNEFGLVAATLVGNAADRLGQARVLQQAIERIAPSAPPVIVSAIGTDRPRTAAWQALADGRVAIGGRFFVDEGIDAVEARDIGSAVPLPNVLAVLTIERERDAA
jgi:hypothetical protein